MQQLSFNFEIEENLSLCPVENLLNKQGYYCKRVNSNVISIENFKISVDKEQYLIEELDKNVIRKVRGVTSVLYLVNLMSIKNKVENKK